MCHAILYVIRTWNAESTPLGKIAKDGIAAYMQKHRPSYVHPTSYHEFFPELYVPQMKEMLDITLGLDVLEQKFYEDGKALGFHRHHVERDRDFIYLFDITKSGKFSLKLIPLLGSRHMELHGLYRFQRGNFPAYLAENDLLRARVWHLYQLSKRSYVPGIDYMTQFMMEFEGREDVINGRTVKIWDQFDRGKLEEWIEKWKNKKKMTNIDWYNKYYKIFFNKRFLTFMYDMKSYILNDPKCKNPEFWDWYLTQYKPNLQYP